MVFLLKFTNFLKKEYLPFQDLFAILSGITVKIATICDVRRPIGRVNLGISITLYNTVYTVSANVNIFLYFLFLRKEKVRQGKEPNHLQARRKAAVLH